VIAVPTEDPYADEIHELTDIPPHALKEIEHFFQVYKDLEGVTTRTRGFEDAQAAREAISEAIGLYRKKFGKAPRTRKRAVRRR
jgi:inorganic pyrophosphatase